MLRSVTQVTKSCRQELTAQEVDAFVTSRNLSKPFVTFRNLIFSAAFDKFEWLFVIPAKAGIHGSPIKAFGDDKFELPLEFIEQRIRS